MILPDCQLLVGTKPNTAASPKLSGRHQRQGTSLLLIESTKDIEILYTASGYVDLNCSARPCFTIHLLAVSLLTPATYENVRPC